MKNLFKIFMTLSVSILFFSCQKEPEPIEVGKMTGFDILAENNPSIFYDIEFEISENAITATIPEFMKSMEFIPTFTFEGKEMLVLGEPQVSGETVQDFSKPVKYQIISHDGMITEYEVKINYPVPESAEITSFSFRKEQNINLEENLQMEINGTEITGVLPRKMDVEALVPTFTYEGAAIQVEEVDQISGVSAQNFSRAVHYVVTNKEGLSVTYIVKLVCPVAKSLPVIRITTTGNAPVADKVNYVPGEIMIEDPDCKYWDQPVFNATMRIRGRGNTTWNMPKKPYRIKLDVAASVFGRPENRDWVLLANYADKSLLRNSVAMKLSEIVEMEWTPVMLPVEVYLNDAYLGCYTFTEHKEVSSGRVNIKPAGPQDIAKETITGDYYLEIDTNHDEPVFWTTQRCHLPVVLKDPENAVPEQADYLKQYFADTEAALMGADFTDPVKGYAAWIDVDSFIKYFIVEEIVKNIDGNMRKSTYMTKERDQKLKMYHVWDFDIALGNCNYFHKFFKATNDPEGWFIKTCSDNELSSKNKRTNWYTRLFMDPVFRTKVKEKWNAVKPQLYKIPEFIDNQAEDLLMGAADRNFKQWDILKKNMWPNVVVTGSYMGEVCYMKDFYVKRVAWLDAEISAW